MEKRPLLIALLALLAVAVGRGEEQRLFREDFEVEQAKPLRMWATNAADWKVHFAGVSDERSFGGQRSFKLDLTINGGNWHYWWLPVRIPFWAPLKFRGRVFNERPKNYRVLLGVGYAVPSAGTQGNVVQGKLVARHENGWEEWETDLSSMVGMSETAFVQGLAVYIFARRSGFKDTRVTVYVDDFVVEGHLPADYKQQLGQKLRALEQAREREVLRRSRRLRRWARDLIEQMPAAQPKMSGWLAQVQRRLEDFCRQGLEQVEKELQVLERTPTDKGAMKGLSAALPLLRLAVQSLRALPTYAQSHADKPYLLYIVNPIQDLRILPRSFPVAGIVGTELKVFACRGEFEPASFAISANEELKGVRVAVSPLRHSARPTRDAPSVDVRVVKVWWQAGLGISDVRHPTLTPELLLHDEAFVSVGPNAQEHRNALKDPQTPRDATTLQPVDIPEGTTKQFWLTVRVPPQASPGLYRGSVDLLPANAAPLRLVLEVEVYPFDLEEPLLEYAIYYRGRLSPDGKPTIGSERKSEQQFEAELRNMKEHGVVLPTCYTGFRRREDGTYDFSQLQRVMEIYRRMGLTKGPIVVMGGVNFYEFVRTKDPKRRQEILQQAVEATKALAQFCRAHGYPPLAFYGIDEASGETLAAERDLFRAIVEAGGMTAVACGWDFFPAVGRWLTRPIIAIGHPECYPQVHALGYKVWIYNRPQVGVEAPERYRRSYGLMLWQRGEDGACTYAYQHAFGESIYDDFDHPAYRDHVFAYPTVDGVIDTVQWEGFREGVDDVRYLTTLLKVIQEAKGRKRNRALAERAEKWLQDLELEEDLDALRRQMAQWIQQLRR